MADKNEKTLREIGARLGITGAKPTKGFDFISSAGTAQRNEAIRKGASGSGAKAQLSISELNKQIAERLRNANSQTLQDIQDVTNPLAAGQIASTPGNTNRPTNNAAVPSIGTKSNAPTIPAGGRDEVFSQPAGDERSGGASGAINAILNRLNNQVLSKLPQDPLTAAATVGQDIATGNVDLDNPLTRFGSDAIKNIRNLLLGDTVEQDAFESLRGLLANEVNLSQELGRGRLNGVEGTTASGKKFRIVNGIVQVTS